jgi:CubicO group peptidase (beta-lactamase class C family)
LTSRVAEIIPEFGINGKRRITVGQLLTHTSGMPLGLAPVPLEKMGDLAANFEAICSMSPLTAPGTTVSYSASIGFVVLGELIRRLDPQGRPYRQIMNEDLLAPLKMTSSVVGSRADLGPRRVPIAVSDAEPNVFGAAVLLRLNEVLTETAELPGGGGWSSAEDMLRFAEMLRLGGALDGVRILSPAMVQLASSIHTGERPNNLMTMMREENFIAEAPANLGLGFTVRGEGIHFTQFGTLASPRTFGALGIGSMLFWVDPERELSCVILTAGLLGQYNNYRRFQKLSDMAIASLVDLRL